MIGKLIRNNSNAGKKNYSIIHWQTGEPTEEGEYLVSISICRGKLEVDKVYWDNLFGWNVSIYVEILAWCKLSDIKPFKDE